MLAKVDTSRGNITVHNTNAERLPFGDGAFDVVTGYAFLHHLEDFRPVLREAFRVLKPGGLGYFDLDPNRLFWKALMDLEGSHAAGLSDIIQREIQAILHLDEQIEAEYGIKKELFQKAEPMKAFQGGLHPAEFKAAAEECGFSECDVRFEWFLGQGAVMHGQSFEASATVEAYLRRALPLTGHLFKYLQFLVRK
jgi:ubiquinone/menaquinone biosynthesis C-methylase UbiE